MTKYLIPDPFKKFRLARENTKATTCPASHNSKKPQSEKEPQIQDEKMKSQSKLSLFFFGPKVKPPLKRRVLVFFIRFLLISVFIIFANAVMGVH